MQNYDTNTRTSAHNENTPITPRDLNATPEELEFLQLFREKTPATQTIILETIKAAANSDTQMLKGLKLCLPEHSHGAMNELIEMCGGEV